MDLTQFKCQRCNKCCEQPGDVTLRHGEEELMAQFLGLDTRDFVNQYCDMPVKPRLILKENTNQHCIFLTKEGCSIYAARPSQCRDFPLKWIAPTSFDTCEGLQKLL